MNVAMRIPGKIKNVPTHIRLMGIWGFILGLFLFLRLYQIETGLFFFNDMGRDFNELREWWVTGKPPLLGPQNSALPFNQPNIYFGWLMPMYVLTQFSPWSSVYTLVVTYVAVWLVAGWWGWHRLRDKQYRGKQYWWPTAILIVGWFITIHPQHIWQNRFVWNPSLVPPFLAVALGALLQLRRQWSWPALLVMAGTLSLAVSFTYALAPVWLTIMLLAMWWWRHQWLRLGLFWLTNGLALAFWHLPTLFFEIKYQFLLTKAILSGGQPLPKGLTLASKWHDLMQHALHADNWYLSILLVCILSLILVLSWQQYRQEKNSFRKMAFNTMGLIGSGSLLVTFLVPIAIHAHYVFGLTTILFWLIGSTPRRLALILVLLLTAWWLRPSLTHSYLAPARRSVATAQACAQSICQQANWQSLPVFVSTESRHHVFHNGPEWRYFLAQAGCQVKHIEREPTAAQHMVVIEDDGNYDHGRTQYHELSLFGPSRVTNIIDCPQKVRGFILEKIEPAR